MKQLYKAGFPVPQVFWLESENDLLGRPFVIMEKINGRPMGDVIGESTGTGQKELLTLFCRIFARLHRLEWRSFASDSQVNNTAVVMKHTLSQWQERFHCFRDHGFDPVFDWLGERLAGIRFGQPSVIHWDYHPWNILLRDDGQKIECIEFFDVVACLRRLGSIVISLCVTIGYYRRKSWNNTKIFNP
ncbi:MAG: phosphotransferase [Spirochaetales bacterium]|nr:phosphotransferase [Spirochaetales bacterium]